MTGSRATTNTEALDAWQQQSRKRSRAKVNLTTVNVSALEVRQQQLRRVAQGKVNSSVLEQRYRKND